MFVMADNFVFQNPAHRKLAKRYEIKIKKSRENSQDF